MTSEAAQTLALKALGFLANSEGALDRLMDQTGLDAGTLRTRAGEPDMLASLLDFLLADEGLLVVFCDEESVDARAVHMARHTLSGA